MKHYTSTAKDSITVPLSGIEYTIKLDRYDDRMFKIEGYFFNHRVSIRQWDSDNGKIIAKIYSPGDSGLGALPVWGKTMPISSFTRSAPKEIVKAILQMYNNFHHNKRSPQQLCTQ